jgi:hypothetical protein
LVKARQAGVQAVHLSSRTHRDPATLDAAIRDVLVAAAVDVVFLGMSDVCTEIEDLALAVKRALDATALEIEVERPNAIER